MQTKHDIKIICSGPSTGDSCLSEYINILHELTIFNFHPQGPVCLFLPSGILKNVKASELQKKLGKLLLMLLRDKLVNR